ncbi:hypothetical protein KAR91_48775 [Candidatus Pacearchaeota archaeon]|nr:hypothetical protein [Candidatus Pacearchaeota archaeon]
MVQDIDRGFNRIKKQFSIRSSFTKVGLPQNGVVATSTSKRDDQIEITEMSDLVMVGVANEFGTKRIPERSFLRTATDENRRGIIQLQEKMVSDVYQNKRTIKQGLSVIGEFLTGKVKKKIVDIKTPVNATSTLKRKYPKTNPLIDKGQLVQSIQHIEVVK